MRIYLTQVFGFFWKLFDTIACECVCVRPHTTPKRCRTRRKFSMHNPHKHWHLILSIYFSVNLCTFRWMQSQFAIKLITKTFFGATEIANRFKEPHRIQKEFYVWAYINSIFIKYVIYVLLLLVHLNHAMEIVRRMLFFFIYWNRPQPRCTSQWFHFWSSHV